MVNGPSGFEPWKSQCAQRAPRASTTVVLRFKSALTPLKSGLSLLFVSTARAIEILVLTTTRFPEKLPMSVSQLEAA